MTKQIRNPAVTREAILKAAQEMFTLKGYDGASLSDIARLAAINKSLIHHYFGSKEELHIAVLRRSFPSYAGRLAEYLRQAESAEDRISAGFTAYFRFLAETPGYVRTGLWISLYLGDDTERSNTARQGLDTPVDDSIAYVRSAGQRFIASIEEGQKKGRLRADLPAADLMATIFCLAEHWHESRALMGLRLGEDFLKAGASERFAASALEVLLHGVSPSREVSK